MPANTNAFLEKSDHIMHLKNDRDKTALMSPVNLEKHQVCVQSGYDMRKDIKHFIAQTTNCPTW